MATLLNPKEIAERFESDPRTVRKFLRSVTPKEEQPGKGHRWAIEAQKVRSLKKQFIDWETARKAKDEEEVPAKDNSDNAPNEDEAVEVLDEADLPEELDEVELVDEA